MQYFTNYLYFLTLLTYFGVGLYYHGIYIRGVRESGELDESPSNGVVIVFLFGWMIWPFYLSSEKIKDYKRK